MESTRRKRWLLSRTEDRIRGEGTQSTLLGSGGAPVAAGRLLAEQETARTRQFPQTETDSYTHTHTKSHTLSQTQTHTHSSGALHYYTCELLVSGVQQKSRPVMFSSFFFFRK